MPGNVCDNKNSKKDMMKLIDEKKKCTKKEKERVKIVKMNKISKVSRECVVLVFFTVKLFIVKI